MAIGIPNGFSADRFKIPPLEDFISDTLQIVIPQDSSINPENSPIKVMDSRDLDETIIGIRQTKKLKYIPVDQYLDLDQPLADIFQSQFVKDSLDLSGTLHLSKLILWTDNSSVLQKGLCLSAYTTFHDSLDQPVSDWIWELRVKREKKEADTLYLGRVVQKFAREQARVLSETDFNPDFYPHLFRRQLLTWSEFIYFEDGFAINAHFRLDFPADQESKWRRGSPGLFYRRSDIHESIAIGGKDQQWFQRLSPRWITQVSGTYRFGFNNFERGHFDHLEYYNVFYVNVSAQAALEYRPVYHKGVFGGFGVYAGYNILPDVVPQTEMGLLLRVGLLLP
ncbi:MAG: hypothetical protein HN995_13850 [Candidatus Marinimicrobia bacterium]|nr:hypothetical protein [Candidatus Neomarinimicrobiota bacterium]MBT3575581.1 hypothetical protein [Candidatus Neomarinimicrobiota bacterium]MBT3679678.1 hypothetical protein [Candidatus Neomarinimicrobiota bacterium]MBT3950635.1 hypothetical protein [Candidatus Neomarinimicrobiota bacterium]MBT4253378.1 hypothetical protein [Candidatus Neomarinimicrobiota bacterium]